MNFKNEQIESCEFPKKLQKENASEKTHSENKAGYFTEKYKTFLQQSKKVDILKPSNFDVSKNTKESVQKISYNKQKALE